MDVIYIFGIICASVWKQVVKVIWQKAALQPHVDGIISVLYSGPPHPPLKFPLPVGDLVPLANPSPHAKRHVIRFSIFCRAHDHDRPTDRPLFSVCSNRLHLRSTAMRQIIAKIIFFNSWKRCQPWPSSSSSSLPLLVWWWQGWFNSLCL